METGVSTPVWLMVAMVAGLYGPGDAGAGHGGGVVGVSRRGHVGLSGSHDDGGGVGGRERRASWLPGYRW